MHSSDCRLRILLLRRTRGDVVLRSNDHAVLGNRQCRGDDLVSFHDSVCVGEGFQVVGHLLHLLGCVSRIQYRHDDLPIGKLWSFGEL
jgi:hypothetical protein